MRCRFKNIGLIKDATLELGALTILAGPNNAGKSYITYALYGFYQVCGDYFSLGESMKALIKDLQETKHADLDLLGVDFNAIISAMAEGYSRHLHEIFSAKKDDFKNPEFFIVLDDVSERLSSLGKNPESLTMRYGSIKLHATLQQIEKRPHISFDLSAGNTHDLTYIPINHCIARLVLPHILSAPYIGVSERLGIPLFYKDLDVQKIALIEHLQKTTDGTNNDLFAKIPEIVQSSNSRYGLPVRESINFVRSIQDLISSDSSEEIAALCEYIVEMTGGVYRYQQPEGLIFSSKKYVRNNKFSLTVNLWSSSVKSLSSLFFYLKHIAQSGQLLIIDEPEIHLTPKNQIILARLLAACVNAGLQVWITTHSDYLIKEFNNLIMLYQLPQAVRETIMNHKGATTPSYRSQELLNPKLVRAYSCTGGRVTECPKDHFGIAVSSIDDVIVAMNDTANELAMLLAENVLQTEQIEE
ncbi:AAA family ATPase [Candidatus Magnetaquicoccus inordinatus]|uniref:AAA family ATPase n=1 Tax=Candidatus Magnetaquicoccus inordinatus TaxID=2496818 RepID=UPI00102B226F|nr:AAA family ATPase [Candidatus Magnetaquicoccus inordinatus]